MLHALSNYRFWALAAILGWIAGISMIIAQA